MAKPVTRLRLPVLRRRDTEMGRPLRGLRRVEHHRRGSRRRRPGPGRQRRRRQRASSPSSVSPAAPSRRRARATGIAELDRVLGGGLVPASAVLVGGDPGIGKSTLLLQAAAALARAGTPRAATSPARKRSTRCACAPAGWAWPTRQLELAAAINLRDIVASLEPARDAALVVIDSIQTMWLDSIDSAPGTVTQVRACAFELIRLAKPRGFAAGAGRPRHQGRRHRRPARAGAHGRRGAVFRRRARPPVPHPARA